MNNVQKLQDVKRFLADLVLDAFVVFKDRDSAVEPDDIERHIAPKLEEALGCTVKAGLVNKFSEAARNYATANVMGGLCVLSASVYAVMQAAYVERFKILPVALAAVFATVGVVNKVSGNHEVREGVERLKKQGDFCAPVNELKL